LICVKELVSKLKDIAVPTLQRFAMKLKFLGATGTVTGSKFRLTSGATSILVDCGLFQGVLRLRNHAAGELS
jgi:hypothetical protein